MQRLRNISWILAGLCLVPGWASVAQADEIFICDGNKVLKVALSELEELKRTHPCVAAHYGLVVKSARPAEQAKVQGRLGLVSSKTKAAAQEKTVSEKVKLPVKTVAKQKPMTKKGAAAAKNKTAKPTEKAPSGTSEFKVYQADEALPVEEVQAKPSDYRNIRVLNAKSRPAKWYRHVY